jgi:type VI secretion system protein ImpF
MPELAPKERLQPSLLDRLTDEQPEHEVESRERRVMSIRTLREGVLRDLAWLLNTTNLFSAQDLRRHAHIANSVLNFGMPDISGYSMAGLNVSDLERGIRQAIWDFEPRLMRPSVTVKAISSKQPGTTQSNHKILFEIEGDLWAQPYPERLYLKTELDVDSGSIRLTDMAGQR